VLRSCAAVRLFRARTTGGLLGRFALLAVLVTGAVAATTAVAGLLKVQTIVDYLRIHPAIKAQGLAIPKPGAPQPSS
jgi:hypothetical protein